MIARRRGTVGQHPQQPDLRLLHPFPLDGDRVACYFALAVAAHIRADDARNLPTPLTILLMAAGVLILQVV
jgi:hypothetical protein